MPQTPTRSRQLVAGEPCPCGQCNGVLATAPSPSARALVVLARCDTCRRPLGGAKGFYRLGEEHFTTCRSCSLKGRRHFANPGPGGPRSAGQEHPFTTGLAAALDRKGLTLADAVERAGLARSSYGSVSAWTRGETRPFRDTVEKLLAVVDAPELIDLLETRTRPPSSVVRRCPLCKTEETIRWWSLSPAQRDAVDLETRRLDWRCQRCAASDTRSRQIRNTRRRSGGAAKIAQQLERARGARDPVAVAAHMERMREARGQTAREEWNRHMAAGLIRPRPRGDLTICVVCGGILFHHWSDRGHTGAVHRSCRKRELQGGAYRQPRRMRPGKLPSSAELALDFEVAVRWLLKGEELGDWNVDSRAGTGLAAELSVRTGEAFTHIKLRRRVKALVDRLEVGARAYLESSARKHRPQVVVWAEALTDAWSRRDI